MTTAVAETIRLQEEEEEFAKVARMFPAFCAIWDSLSLDYELCDFEEEDAIETTRPWNPQEQESE